MGTPMADCKNSGVRYNNFVIGVLSSAFDTIYRDQIWNEPRPIDVRNINLQSIERMSSNIPRELVYADD